MTTATLIRLATETARHLSHAISVSSATHMLPSYNAILGEAQTMYPNERFLHVLKPFPLDHPDNDESISIAELSALYAQIAIVLESLQNDPPTNRQ